MGERLAGVGIKSENFILAAGRTKTFADARVNDCVRFVAEIAAGKPVSPDVAELIEVIECDPRHQCEIGNRVNDSLKKTRGLYRVIADEGGCDPKVCRIKGRSCPAFTRL